MSVGMAVVFVSANVASFENRVGLFNTATVKTDSRIPFSGGRKKKCNLPQILQTLLKVS